MAPLVMPLHPAQHRSDPIRFQRLGCYIALLDCNTPPPTHTHTPGVTSQFS